jgi:hypothetical protein
MKNTLLIKRIDFYAQVVALVGPVACGAVWGLWTIGFTYLTVGGVQFVSSIINWYFLDKYLRDSTRIAYEWVLGILVVLFVAALLIEPLLPLCLLALMYVSPLLAIWYMAISYLETRKVHEYVDREQYVKL